MSKCPQWYKTQPGYVEYGPWGWDDDRLWSKIKKTDKVSDCWIWQGSMSPSGALMGAWKNNGKQQMTQARRLVWMSVNQEDVSPYRVTMQCQRQDCLNPHHFEIKETNRPDKLV